MRIQLEKLLILFVLLGVTTTQSFSQEKVPTIPFSSVANWPSLPNGQNFGEVAGVAVDSKGNVYVFSRSNSANGPAYGAAAAQLFEFSSKGDFIREFGRGLYAWSEAHSVRIDKEDNIWAIDKGSDMIVKFNQAGRVVMVFGRKKEADENPKGWEHVNPPLPPQESSFREPTDVAWDSQGNIYITDGYINSRVVKFDKNGDYVTSWGSPGTGPGQFNLPHSLVIDKDDNVYVGDRSNHRVQVFDTNGNFKRTFEVDVPPDPTSKTTFGVTPTGDRLKAQIGAPNSLCIPPDNPNVLFLGETTFPGRIFKLSLDGTVLGVMGKSGRLLGEFSGAHGLACPSEHLIYVAETVNWRVQKLVLH